MFTMLRHLRGVTGKLNKRPRAKGPRWDNEGPLFFKALLVIRLTVELVLKRNRAFAQNLPKPLNSGDAAGVCCLNTPAVGANDGGAT